MKTPKTMLATPKNYDGYAALTLTRQSENETTNGTSQKVITYINKLIKMQEVVKKAINMQYSR